MIHSLTRMASLALAFGFFISCSTPQSSTKTHPSDNLSEKQIQQRLDTLNKRLAEGSKSGDLLYQKGFYLAELAQKKSHPSERTDIYSEVHRLLSDAAHLYQDSLQYAKKEKVQELLKINWSNEHNQGVQILQSDSVAEKPNFLRAAAHFKNATTIIPDSSISYEMQARAYYKNQQPRKAIEALEKGHKRVENPPVTTLEQLAFLYLENNQPRKAVEVYEEAESFSGQNLNLIHGLSNAYMEVGNHQKAIDLLNQLLENKPDNIIYRQSLATELYLFGAQKMQTVADGLQDDATLEETEFKSAVALLDKAEKQFQQVMSENPEDAGLKLQFARFYQNSASKYQRLLSLVESNQKEEVVGKIEQYLSSSIPLLEQLSQEDSSDKQIWQNLYQAYAYLGMEEKARKAKSNF